MDTHRIEELTHLYRNGHACIVVDDRETTDLATTVRNAVADAQQAGVTAVRVEIPDVEQINADLASVSP